MGTKFVDLGLKLLDDDDDGTLVDQIKADCHHKSANIVAEIFTRWVRGKGKKPVTWRTLKQVLSSIGLTELACSIEQSLTNCS